MMTKHELEELYEYNRWANEVTVNACASLSTDRLTRDLGTSHGSVHGTLIHTLAAEWIWLMRCNGFSPASLLDPADYPTIEALKAKWAEVEQGQSELFADLTDQRLLETISYINTRGERWKYPFGQILQHVVNHSTYHRGQITTLLRQLGAEPVATDLLEFADWKSQNS